MDPWLLEPFRISRPNRCSQPVRYREIPLSCDLFHSIDAEAIPKEEAICRL